MRILLIHPEDDPEKGPWATLPWDQIVDLGLAGMNSYERWTRHFRCPIVSLNSFGDGFYILRQVRDLLGLGCMRLIDKHGLDWWEIMSILLTSEVESLILLQRFLLSVGSGDELYVSRPGLHANLLQCLLPGRVLSFPMPQGFQRAGLAHYLRVYKKLTTRQIIDVFCDKYDSGYQLRGRVKGKRVPSNRPVVLLPTAYINVSRTGMVYADTFPDENFLLVATRRSGWLQDPPPNVATAWLSSYAALQDRSTEYEEIRAAWDSLLRDLEGEPVFEVLSRVGYLNTFPKRFHHGLEVRDAWRNVLDAEPVQGVLCADDSNPYTRIPLLLAQARGLPNVACHHGALDGRYIFKRTYGDVVWAKGKMEEDYLVRRCGVPQERVEVAAPAAPAARRESDHTAGNDFRPYLLFISEAADVSGGRSQEFWRDILPPLADLALASGRELIIKLHPAESEHDRAAGLAGILSSRQNSVTHIVSGPLTEDLLEKTWFGITILSTVAIDCAVRGIPCFLCRWLEFWPYGYVEQFLRFGVAIGLNHPDEIRKIPEYLQYYPVNSTIKENCWQPAAPGRLRELLFSSRDECPRAAS